MTTRDETRRGTADLRPESARADAARESSRDAARDTSRSASDEPSMSLPERLYAARERKGVDLYRAERDTKIRARYLAALERGDYRELPGAVYTKGFLRNYALYLGLEPEEILNQWRRERGDAGAPQPVIAVPQPLDQPRRGLTFSPGIVVAALVTIVVLARRGVPAVQVLRFAKPPTLAVTNPSTATLTVDQDTDSYVLRGHDDPRRHRHDRGRRHADAGRRPIRPVTGACRSTSGGARTSSRSTATDPDTGKRVRGDRPDRHHGAVRRDRGADADRRPAGRRHDRRERRDPRPGHDDERDERVRHGVLRRPARRRPGRRARRRRHRPRRPR